MTLCCCHANTDTRILDARTAFCAYRPMASENDHVVLLSYGHSRFLFVEALVGENECHPWQRVSVSSILATSADSGSRQRNYCSLRAPTKSR